MEGKFIENKAKNAGIPYGTASLSVCDMQTGIFNAVIGKFFS